MLSSGPIRIVKDNSVGRNTRAVASVNVYFHWNQLGLFGTLPIPILNGCFIVPPCSQVLQENFETKNTQHSVMSKLGETLLSVFALYSLKESRLTAVYAGQAGSLGCLALRGGRSLLTHHQLMLLQPRSRLIPSRHQLSPATRGIFSGTGSVLVLARRCQCGEWDDGGTFFMGPPYGHL